MRRRNEFRVWVVYDYGEQRVYMSILDWVVDLLSLDLVALNRYRCFAFVVSLLVVLSMLALVLHIYGAL